MTALRAASFPTLIVTGGERPVYEAVAERLARGIGARHAVVPGPHQTQDVGEPFNELVDHFLAQAGSLREAA